MHLDRSFRKVPLLPILEECRRLLVTAMINNRTLVIRLGYLNNNNNNNNNNTITTSNITNNLYIY